MQGRITLLRASDQILKVLVATVMDKKQHSSKYVIFELTVTRFWDAGCWHFLFIPAGRCSPFLSEERDLNAGTTVAQQSRGKATLGPATCVGILQCKGKRVV